MSKCRLRKTMVKLLDGNEYAFRELPLLDDEVAIIFNAFFNGDGQKMDLAGLARCVRRSLSYDNTPEQVADIIGNGLIQLSFDEGTPEAEVFAKALAAMVAQFAKA